MSRQSLPSPTRGRVVAVMLGHMGNAKTAGKWAPWWSYVVIIAGCNLGKQQLLAGRVSDVANVAITVVMVAILFAAITAVYRVSHTGR
jgi:hypothetical protein